MRPVDYKQTDPHWRNTQYSSRGDKSQTIGSSGCGPTCAAMVIATLRNKNVTPVSCCQWALAQGYRTANNGTEFGYFPAQFAEFGIPCRYTWDKDEAEAALRKGLMVIGRALAGLWTSSGHFILGYGLEDGKVLVNDPNSTAENKEKAPLAAWHEQVGPFWIIEEEWKMEIKTVEVVVKDNNGSQLVSLPGINVNGANLITLRSLATLFPVEVDYDEEVHLPVVRLNDSPGNGGDGSDVPNFLAWLAKQYEQSK